MKYKFALSATIAILLISTIASAVANPESLEITNFSNIGYRFTYQQLAEMPKTTVHADLYCDGVLITSGEWVGVQLSYLLNQTEITSDVKSIQFLAADNYAVSIPIYVVQLPETIIAYERDGRPLAEGLRLVLPGINGASWIAQIESITMSNNADVAAPAPMSARSVLADFNGRGVAPTPSIAPVKPTTADTPFPTTPAPTQSIPSENNTVIEQAPKQDMVTDQKSISLRLESVVLIILAGTIGFALAALTFSIRRKSVKNRML